LPRDLADVLHYFLPELEAPTRTTSVAGPSRAATGPNESSGSPERPTAAIHALPVLGLAVGDRDVVRATLVWNLAVETARLSGTAVLLTPESEQAAPLWPEPGPGPLGCELIVRPAKDLASLYDQAHEIARERAEDNRGGGTVFVRIPPEWLQSEMAPPGHPRWHLLLSGRRPAELDEAIETAAQLIRTHPGSDIGLSIHGVTRVEDARRAFEHASERLERETGQAFVSYGLLVNDLHVFRAIAAQRPIGLAHPEAPAARALTDVARLISVDARSRSVG
jgi:hypothetical protein